MNHAQHSRWIYKKCLHVPGQIPSGGNELKSLINGLKKEKRSPSRKYTWSKNYEPFIFIDMNQSAYTHNWIGCVGRERAEASNNNNNSWDKWVVEFYLASTTSTHSHCSSGIHFIYFIFANFQSETNVSAVAKLDFRYFPAGAVYFMLFFYFTNWIVMLANMYGILIQ